MQVIQSIQNRIYEIRGERVMLDFDLAVLYGTETRIFNQSVKRNIKRFPKDFMFRLTRGEWHNMRSQIVTAYSQNTENQSTIIATDQAKRNTHLLPYAFTEQGVAMLSGILNSDKAIHMNIAIMRAFIELRRVLLLQADIATQLKELKERVGGHDVTPTLPCRREGFVALLRIKFLYTPSPLERAGVRPERKWNERERIGFKASTGSA